MYSSTILFDRHTFISSRGTMFYELFLISITIIIILCFPLWRILVWFWISWKYEDSLTYQRLNLLDQLFSCSPCEVMTNFILEFDSFVDLHQFRKHFLQTFLSSEETKDSFLVFRQVILVVGGVAFKKPVAEVDLTYHLREIWVVGHEDPGKVIEEVVQDNSRIDRWEIPNWEVVLLQFPSGTTIVWKMSRWMLDGISFSYLIHTILKNQETTTTSHDDGRDITKVENFTFIRRLVRLLKTPFAVLRCLGRLLVMSLSTHGPYPEIVRESRESSSSSSGLVHENYQAFFTLELSSFKKVSKLTNCKILPIILHMHVTTIQKLMLIRQRQKQDADGKDSDTKCRRIPIIMIASSDERSHLFLPDERNKCTNNCWIDDLILIPLNYDEMDNQSHIKVLNDSIQQDGSSSGPSAVYRLSNWITSFLPHKLITCLGNRFWDCKSYLTIINPFLFPEHCEYTLLGKKLTRLYCVIRINPARSMAEGSTIITPVTFGGKIFIGIRASSAVFKNQEELEFYVTLFKEEIIENLLLRTENKDPDDE